MMNALKRAEIVGRELVSLYCDFDAAGIVAPRAGAVFLLPGVLMTEVQMRVPIFGASTGEYRVHWPPSLWL